MLALWLHAVAYHSRRYSRAKAKKETNMKLKITQVRSVIGALQNQKDTIKALGLGRPNYVTVKPKNVQILGMINVVRHLVNVEEIAD
ncbi:MAG: 50S ribosomal protein L30 [Ignavibacteria bacterium]|jgi:large subunit ribosomal protein L30|nr:50S ribosomal protein L30 [Ignavibacteria bacterium]MBK6419385.1 50S ribosomal protein L30 [Ignavibacteria bacterium]MBK6759984.1 50S ribosomal protein L30 [Ignavibacteria bacterium]MBK7413675.1 50S ribosomal protein L30 [Ignavibacteria bacterium]MBL0321366.1 50S ribosomal protein L30 [Ignavibacteria bacterium]